MASIPSEALADGSHDFWRAFWKKVENHTPEQVMADLHIVPSGVCPNGYLWTSGVTRDGYGRVVTGVQGEMRAHHIAWAFLHRDPVPPECDVAHARWCTDKLCCWPGCQLVVTSKRFTANITVQRLMKMYNDEVLP